MDLNQVELLSRIRAAALEAAPGATGLVFGSNGRTPRGFQLEELHIHPNVDVYAAFFDIDNAISGLLAELAWGGVMKECRHGGTVLDLASGIAHTYCVTCAPPRREDR